MTGLRGNSPHTLTTPVRLTMQPITLALVALLVTAIVAVAIVLAASGGDDQAGATKSVRVTPSAPTADDIQHSHPPGATAPGARPSAPWRTRRRGVGGGPAGGAAPTLREVIAFISAEKEREGIGATGCARDHPRSRPWPPNPRSSHSWTCSSVPV